MGAGRRRAVVYPNLPKAQRLNATAAELLLRGRLVLSVG
jgi:hypothetical protein